MTTDVSMNQLLSDLYPWITGAIGGLAGAAMLLPTKLGEAIFKFRFDRAIEGLKAEQTRAIEAFKADQVQQLERLKEQLNHLGDRGKRSNEMEFAAIRTVWEKFVEAYLATTTCAIAAVEHPDFTRMSDEAKDAFISGSDLSDENKNRLREADDQNKEYVAIYAWQQIVRAGRDQHELRLAIQQAANLHAQAAQ